MKDFIRQCRKRKHSEEEEEEDKEMQGNEAVSNESEDNSETRQARTDKATEGKNADEQLLQEKLKHLQEKLKTYENKVEELTTRKNDEISSLEQQITSYRCKMQQMRSQLKEKDARLLTLEGQVQSQKMEILALERNVSLAIQAASRARQACINSQARKPMVQENQREMQTVQVIEQPSTVSTVTNLDLNENNKPEDEGHTQGNKRSGTVKVTEQHSNINDEEEEQKYDVIVVEYSNNTMYMAIEDKENQKIQYAEGRVMRDLSDFSTFKVTAKATVLEKVFYDFEKKFKVCTVPRNVAHISKNKRKILIRDELNLASFIKEKIKVYRHKRYDFE